MSEVRAADVTSVKRECHDLKDRAVIGDELMRDTLKTKNACEK